MFIHPGDMITVQGYLSKNQMRGLRVILEICLGGDVKMTRYGVRTGCESPLACAFLFQSDGCKVGALSV